MGRTQCDNYELYLFMFAGLGMFVINTEHFSHMLKPEAYSSLREAANEFINWKLKTLGKYEDGRQYYGGFQKLHVCVL